MKPLIPFAQPICFVILVALILSFVLASRIAKKIAARQPYAGILCFALLVMKTFGIMKLR